MLPFVSGFLAAAVLIISCAILYGKFLLKKQQDELVGKFTIEINTLYRRMKLEKERALQNQQDELVGKFTVQMNQLYR